MPETNIDIVKSIFIDQSKSCFPLVLYILIFVLYVMCFVSLYKPHLELIGLGLFFVLHIILGYNMATNMNPGSPGIAYPNMDITALDFASVLTMIPKILIFDYLSGNMSTLGKMMMFLITLIPNILGLAFIIITLILFTILYIIALPFKMLVGLGWNGKIPISTTIYIGAALLLVSFVMLIMSLNKVHAQHITLDSPAMPAFLSGGYSIEKRGYTFKKAGPKGEGYYLNTGEGVDFFFNDKKTEKLKDNFKIISITTTVLLWVQYFTFKNYDMLMRIMGNTPFNQQLLNAQFILYGSAIVSLSSVCVWLTQQIGKRMHSIQVPVGKPTTPSL